MIRAALLMFPVLCFAEDLSPASARLELLKIYENAVPICDRDWETSAKPP